MNNKISRFKISVGFILVCVMGFFFTTTAFGSTCQVITIGQTKSTRTPAMDVIPEKITVPVGGCTVWNNSIRDQAVTVSFREKAKPCEQAAGAPAGFFLDMKGGKEEACYMTEPMPHGKTTSITWDEPGVYKYTIEMAGTNPDVSKGKKLAYGIIEVK
jgi:hypothetical protein